MPPLIREPRFLLIYPPLQFRREDSAKPDGSLALPYLAGALRAEGYPVDILDACVGSPRDPLHETFFSPRELDNGLVRVGMSPEAIAREVEPYDVVGITSIFTAQTSRVIEVIKVVKAVSADKLVIVGGVNARHLAQRFFNAGADIVCLSEGESTIVELAKTLRSGSDDFSSVPGVEFQRDGIVIRTPPRLITDLDELPLPAWDMLPLQRYWAISRPHGGGFSSEAPLHYGSLMTSRGCPFNCEFCHISKEHDGSDSGDIRQLRLKSEARVMQEIDRLQSLGVNYIFLEDDSLLAKKNRAMRIFDQIRLRKLTLSAVNGVNIIHLFRSVGGRRVVDAELLDSMALAGMREVSLPFESGSQRIINTYAAGKLDLTLDLDNLIKTMKSRGFIVGGNYTFGYPDETYDEMTQTILLAQRHMELGMDRANLMIIVPFPGTALFDRAIRGGYLSSDFDPDLMNWMYPAMTQTIIHPEVLRYITRLGWQMLNHDGRKTSIADMAPTPRYTTIADNPPRA